MRVLYAVCDTCEALVVEPTAYPALLDGKALVHADTTGHPVSVFDDSDPDQRLYVVAGQPSLYVDHRPPRGA